MNETQAEVVTPDMSEADDVARIVADVVSIGKAWAVHGLNIGRSALDLSAHSLEVTARLLGDIAKRFQG